MELSGRRTGASSSRSSRATTPHDRPLRGRSASWPVRAGRWVGERHGLAVLVLVAILFALAVSAGAIRTAGSVSLNRIDGWHLVLGGAAFWSWYLMLRVLDDLEDFASDAIAHPERMLQRGAVSRRDLWLLALGCAAFQFVASYLFDAGSSSWTVTATWLVSAAFLALVAVDFGARAALARRPLLRRTLRLPASVLPLAWAYVMGATAPPDPTPSPTTGTVVALMVAGVCTLAVTDVSRKFAPAQAGELSWPQRLGTARAYALLGALVLALGGSCAALVRVAGARWDGTVPAILVGVAVVGAAYVVARRDTDAAPLYALVLLVLTLASLIGAAA